jgi:hypothetical protein
VLLEDLVIVIVFWRGRGVVCGVSYSFENNEMNRVEIDTKSGCQKPKRKRDEPRKKIGRSENYKLHAFKIGSGFQAPRKKLRTASPTLCANPCATNMKDQIAPQSREKQDVKRELRSRGVQTVVYIERIYGGRRKKRRAHRSRSKTENKTFGSHFVFG